LDHHRASTVPTPTPAVVCSSKLWVSDFTLPPCCICEASELEALAIPSLGFLRVSRIGCAFATPFCSNSATCFCSVCGHASCVRLCLTPPCVATRRTIHTPIDGLLKSSNSILRASRFALELCDSNQTKKTCFCIGGVFPMYGLGLLSMEYYAIDLQRFFCSSWRTVAKTGIQRLPSPWLEETYFSPISVQLFGLPCAYISFFPTSK
jgi:hypothetical protein